jgi:tetratricopeptide (TPR) repeat protein
MSSSKDFFISYANADREWAEWIAWQLTENGYQVVLQAWDFRPGTNFITQMDTALAESRLTIAVLSSAYLRSSYGRAEWTAAFIHGYTEQPRLLCIRIEDVEPPSLLRPWIHIDLVGLDAEKARQALLTGLNSGRVRPQTEPEFPGPARASVSIGPAPRFPGQTARVWNLPLSRNPWFSGRTLLLNKLTQALAPPNSSPLVVALWGMGGTGKTALAVEYAHRHQDEYQYVWWVRAEQPATALSDYSALAGPLGLPQRHDNDQTAAAAVRERLERVSGWLLVFDNAHAAANIHSLIPSSGRGHIIITTRNLSWLEDAKVLSVEPLTREEAVSFLRHRTGQDDPAGADQLAQALGDLPLALEQAGAYMEERSIEYPRYLGLLREQSGTDGRTIETPSAHVAIIKATWKIALDAVEEQSPIAVTLLTLCTFLAPSAIPIGLFIQGASTLPDPLSELAAGRGQLDETFVLLRQYSLIQMKSDTVAINEIVCSIVREQVSSEERRQCATAALRLLEHSFPMEPDDIRSWPACDELLPHARAVIAQAEALDVEPVLVALLLVRMATYQRSRAQLQLSRSMSQRALAKLERVLGPDHIHVSSALTELAAAQRGLGALHEAKVAGERAVHVALSQVGSTNRITAEALNDYGITLLDLGSPAQAKTVFERALTALQTSPGDDRVAYGLSNVGLALWHLGVLEQAKDKFLQARAILERSLGPGHPEVVTIIHNIGVVLAQQGDVLGARAHLEWALAAKEAAYGPNHLELASTLGSLGGVLCKLGDYQKACSLLDRALNIEMAVLGSKSFQDREYSE